MKNKKTMKLTPKEIRKVYKSAPPYQVEDIMKHYIGQEVYWDLTYEGLRKFGTGELHIFLSAEDTEVVILCDIHEDDFPLIKIIPKSTPIRLVGTIAKVDNMAIEIKNANLQEIRDINGQIYFPQGSRESLLAFLEGKILGARNIKIYDSWPSEDILKLLESASPKAEIKLLGKNIDSTFSEKIKAFSTYFNKDMVAKKTNVAHARFYIIDGEVLHVDSSLKNSGGNKATMIHMVDKEAADVIKRDFDKWWNDSVGV